MTSGGWAIVHLHAHNRLGVKLVILVMILRKNDNSDGVQHFGVVHLHMQRQTRVRMMMMAAATEAPTATARTSPSSWHWVP